MDVPSWHPANDNSDALRRQALAGDPNKRTEFTVMAGSCADTSTEEGRELVEREEHVAGGGRGLLDTSDRLYLLEQTQLEQAAHSREQQQEETALQNFRSSALKVLKHKTAVPEISLNSTKKLLTYPKKKTVVVVRAKKRQVAKTEKHKTKKAKKAEDKRSAQTSVKVVSADTSKAGRSPDQCEKTSAATALLLAEYASSSSEDE